MQFDLTMINKILENYNIESEEEAIDYLIQENGLWNHPFILKKENVDNNQSGNLQESILERNNPSKIINNIIVKIKKVSLCEICGDYLTNHNNKGNYSELSSINSKDKNNKKKEEEYKNICNICMGDFENKITIPNCKHEFCRDCFKSYLFERINNKNIEKINCPFFECETLLNEEFFFEFLTNEYILKYNTFKMKLELEKSPNKLICPLCDSYADIGKKNEKKPKEKKIYYCIKNKHAICSCGRPKHDGLCESEEKLNEFFQKEKIKKCPKCGAFIKKISGCNHINCAICKYEFCWVCMNPYSPFHYDNGPCRGLQFVDVDSIFFRFRENHPNIYLFINCIKYLLLFMLVLLIIIGNIITPAFIFFMFFMINFINNDDYKINLTKMNRYVKSFVFFIEFANICFETICYALVWNVWTAFLALCFVITGIVVNCVEFFNRRRRRRREEELEIVNDDALI